MKTKMDRLEISKFNEKEVNEAILGLDSLQKIIIPLLKKINLDGLGESDMQEFKKHITMAKHALILVDEVAALKAENEELKKALNEENVLKCGYEKLCEQQQQTLIKTAEAREEKDKRIQILEEKNNKQISKIMDWCYMNINNITDDFAKLERYLKAEAELSKKE